MQGLVQSSSGAHGRSITPTGSSSPGLLQRKSCGRLPGHGLCSQASPQQGEPTGNTAASPQAGAPPGTSNQPTLALRAAGAAILLGSGSDIL